MAFDRELGVEFGFTEEELDVNRAGRLTEEQELIVRNTAAYARRRTPRLSAVMIALFLGAIGLVAYGISTTPGGGLTAGIVAAVILAWIGVLFLWAARRNRKYQADFENPELVTAEGEADFEPVAFDNSIGNMYHLLIDGHELSVTAAQMDAMTAGARYRVHYLRSSVGTPTPSSLERVDQAG